MLTYGAAALRKPAIPVEHVDDAIRELAKGMLQTMRKNNGIGLAAEQVGRTEALCVIDVPQADPSEPGPVTGNQPPVAMPLVMANPRIVSARGEETAPEGCLSFPDIFVPLTRSAEVTVVFVNMDNREEILTATGLLARAVQHELDHLNGVLLVDRMSPVQKVAMASRLKRIKKAAER